MEMSICLNDADNDECMALVDRDLYTFGAKSSRCFPQPQKKCLLPGLVIKKSVPDTMNTSFTVTITGHHLSNNAISTILPTDYINISLVYVTDWSYSYCLRIGLSVAVMARSKFFTRPSPSIPVRYTASPSIPVRYTASQSITNSTKSTLTSLVRPKY